MDSPFIFNYIDKLDIVKKYPSWILAVCPVCGGTLKINVGGYKHGAYACYTNFCHNLQGNLIRKKLYNRHSPFNKKNYRNPFQKIGSLLKVANDVALTTSIEPNHFLTDVKFIKPRQSRLPDKLITYFDYGDFSIVRVDELNNEGNKIKYFYPSYVDSNGKEIQEIPEIINTTPVYRSAYLQENIVFTEGEKCAMIGQYLGLAAVTLPSFLYTERYLDRYLSKLYSIGVRNVIYLRDNDVPGIHKANLVTAYLAKNKIGSKIVNSVELFEDIDHKSVEAKGFDLYDLYLTKLISKASVSSFISKCLAEENNVSN